MASEDNTMLPLPSGSGKRPERLLPDDFWMLEYKVLMCPKRENHDWERCIYAHRGERARRRHPSKYQAVQCPEARAKKVCPRGEACPCTHHLFEYWLHPDRYLTCLCELGPTCNRPICFFAHERAELRPLPAGLVSASELNPGQAWQQLSTPSSRASTPPATASSASSSPPLRQGSSPMSISTAIGASSIGSGQAAFSALDLLTGDDAAAVQRPALAGSMGMPMMPGMNRAAGAALLGGATLPGSGVNQGGGLRSHGNQGQLPAGGLGGAGSGGGVWVPELGMVATTANSSAGNSGNMLPVMQPVKIIRSMSDGYTPSAVLQQQQQQQQQQQVLAAAGFANSNCSSPLGLTAMFQPECATFAGQVGPATSASLSPKSAANTLELLSLGGTTLNQNVLSVGINQQPTMAASMATAAQQLRQQQQQRAVNGFALINSAVMDPQMLSVQQLVDETPEHLSFSLWDLGDQQQQQIFQQQLQQQLQLQQQQQQQPAQATGQVLGMPNPGAGSAVAGSYSPPASVAGPGVRVAAMPSAGSHSGVFSGFQPWSATGELGPAHAVSDRAGSFTGGPATFGSPGAKVMVAGAAATGVPGQAADMFDMQQRLVLLQDGMMAVQQQQQQVALGQGQGDSWWPIMAQQQQQQQQQQLLNKISPSNSWTLEEPASRQLQQQPAAGKRDKGSKHSAGGAPGVLAAAMMSQVQELMVRKKTGTAAAAAGAEGGKGASTSASSPAPPSMGGSAGGSSGQLGPDGAAGSGSVVAAAAAQFDGRGARHSLLSAWLDKAVASSAAASPLSGEKLAAEKGGASLESAGPAASSGAAPLPEEVVAVLAEDVLGLLRPAEVAHLVDLLQSGLQKRSLSAVAGVGEEPVGSTCGEGPVMTARSD